MTTPDPLVPRVSNEAPFYDVMLDLETLAHTADACLVAIGAVGFRAATEPGVPLVSSKQNSLYVVPRAPQRGRSIDVSTIAWWADQPADAKEVLMQSEASDVTLRHALYQLSGFIQMISHGKPNKVRVWGNGASFDNAAIEHAYKQHDQKPGWDFWNNRCYRTLRALRKLPYSYNDSREGVFHHALDDAMHQAKIASVLLHESHEIPTRTTAQIMQANIDAIDKLASSLATVSKWSGTSEQPPGERRMTHHERAANELVLDTLPADIAIALQAALNSKTPLPVYLETRSELTTNQRAAIQAAIRDANL